MERLTGRNEKGDLLLMGEEVYAGDSYEAVTALEEYEDAEEQGLLVRLPCKVFDKVFEIAQNKIVEREIKSIEVYSNGKYRLIYGRTLSAFGSDIGETVFRTREEAEQALKS